MFVKKYVENLIQIGIVERATGKLDCRMSKKSEFKLNKLKYVTNVPITSVLKYGRDRNICFIVEGVISISIYISEDDKAK